MPDYREVSESIQTQQRDKLPKPSIMSVVFVTVLTTAGVMFCGECCAQGIDYLIGVVYPLFHLVFIGISVIVGIMAGVINYATELKFIRLRQKDNERFAKRFQNTLPYYLNR